MQRKEVSKVVVPAENRSFLLYVIALFFGICGSVRGPHNAWNDDHDEVTHLGKQGKLIVKIGVTGCCYYYYI